MAVTVKSLSATGLHLDVFESRVHPNVMTEVLVPLKREVEGAVAHLRSIARSREYTAEGRSKRLAQVRGEALARLEPQRERVAKTRARLMDVETRALAAAKTTDLAGLLLEREIRDRLQGRDPLEIQVQYLDAIERGDEAFVRAVENAPQAFPLLSEAARATGRDAKLRTAPETVRTELAALRDDLQLHQDVLEAAEYDLRTAVTD
jgi:hypothetical protein